jgi:hypothetical protein
MNSLNSILLEGTVSGKLCMAGKGKEKRCSFVVSSSRFFQGKSHATETRVWVMIRDIKMVETAIRSAHDGRRVRVVGWLACDKKDNDLYIEADHVEYRTVKVKTK